MEGDPWRTGPRPPPRAGPIAWAPASAQQAPQAPPPEPDAFWGQAAVHRVPAVSERLFWSDRGRPQHRMPYLLWSGARPYRLGAALLGLGFFAVLVRQAGFIWEPGFLYQLVIGAPVFEEFLKFGLALLLVSFLAPRTPAGRAAAAILLRVPVAFVVGGAFGVFEHHLGYSSEPTHIYVGRILFHGGATALSMVAYTVLESMRDVRARWLAPAPAVILHWLNNASAIPVAIMTRQIPEGDVFLLGWHGGIIALVYAAILAIPVAARPFRRAAAAILHRRLPPMPPHWHRQVYGDEDRAPVTPATAQPATP